MNRILIVDDEPIVCNTIARIFNHNSAATVTTCSSGSEALRLFRLWNFKIVITDVKMPGMDGITLLKILKSIKPNLPVFIITGFATDELEKESLQYKAHQFIPKPFEVQDIKTSIDGLLS